MSADEAVEPSLVLAFAQRLLKRLSLKEAFEVRNELIDVRSTDFFDAFAELFLLRVGFVEVQMLHLPGQSGCEQVAGVMFRADCNLQILKRVSCFVGIFPQEVGLYPALSFFAEQGARFEVHPAGIQIFGCDADDSCIRVRQFLANPIEREFAFADARI